MTDQPRPKALGDLEPVRYLTVHDRMTEFDVICQRCWCDVPEEYARQHTDWHTAIETQAAPNWTTAQPHTGPDIHVYPADPTTPPSQREVVAYLRTQIDALERKRQDCQRLHRPEFEGLWPRELARLRRVESALVELGAPNRSERDDPGGLMIEWARELAGENKLLREERDRFAAELETAKGEDSL